ncbi:MAG: RNA polymerase sporulation sigma factor SigK [Clostridia bacterium]|jgi:RNA polymerase sporulation-specific sigma factor|nr:RNA polymerase sporulation sigma factor SigK [Clostridia bacterium]
MFFDFLSLLFSKIFFFTGMVQSKGTFPKPLSAEEEKKYLALARNGDKTAKEILIKHNMRLVAHIVKKYAGAAETDDLISVGSIGLIKAINTYRDGKGTQLATYTARCIENEILMLLRSGKKHKNVVSITDPVGTDKDGNELTLIDLLYEKEDNVFAQVEKSIQREKFVALLKKILNEREFTIISMRYGLEDGVALPQREVAHTLGISRSYISRIEKRAIEKAREHLNKDDFFTD